MKILFYLPLQQCCHFGIWRTNSLILSYIEIIYLAPLWREQRRFILRNLKDFGFGQTQGEKFIKEEASFMVEYLTECSKQDENFLIHDCFNVFVTNVIWQIVGGKRCYENSNEMCSASYYSVNIVCGGEKSTATYCKR